MSYRTRRCQSTATIADDDCPFDEIAKKVKVEQPKQKSQSLCRPRSMGLWQPAAAAEAAASEIVRGHHAGFISRSRTAGHQLKKKTEIVPKTTFYTPMHRRATTTTTTTTRSYDTSALLARGGVPCIDIDNENDKEVEENPEDDDSSSFSDDASTDSDATSFGTSVSSLTRKFSDLQQQQQQQQSMHLRMSEDNEEEDETNASFSYFQTSKEDTTFLRDTIGSTGTNDDDSMDNDSLNDDIDDQQQQEDDGYTSFRMKQASRVSQKCQMICFVDDSDSVGLEDFLDADNSRQKRPKKRHGRKQQQQQKAEQEKTSKNTTLSYFCESLDCLGAFNGVFWKNESSSSAMDATVPISDFESQAN